MLKRPILDALNEQIQKEGYSANLYLAMASWAETEGYDGITRWLYAQAQEETEHMLKIIGYVNERGGKAVIPAFDKPPAEWNSIREMFDQVLEHEKFVTESIHSIIPIIQKENDYASLRWIQWFVDEQMEEESSVQEIIDKLEMLGDKNLYMFDRDIMGMRAEGGEEA
jgi:ferritin